MNWKSTITLLLLLGVALSLAVLSSLEPAAVVTEDNPLAQVTSASLRKIDIHKAGQTLSLYRLTDQSPWTLPGKWPTRPAETARLVELLTQLRSRFLPSTNFGVNFSPPLLTATLEFSIGGQPKELVLEFTRSAGASQNSFAQPDYFRVKDSPIVYRLGPGVIQALEHPADYYQQRRLFPGERLATTAKEGSLSSSHKGEKLLAKAVTASYEENGKATSFSLGKQGEDWELQKPVGRDQLEAKGRDAFLAAVPDLWAEKFVDAPEEKTGLNKPGKTLTVTRLDGSEITLLIGNVSSTRTSKRLRPNPPGLPPGIPPQEETVTHEMRFAKIKDNSQVFEIEGDKLKDVFVSLDALRNPQLASMNTADARKVEIQLSGVEIVLAKEGDRWKVEKPFRADADGEKVTELLTKASGLEAKGKEIIDGGKAADFGLDKPGKIAITLEEETKPKGKEEKKEKRARTITLLLGNKDAKEKKQFVMVEGYPRINRVDDSLSALIARPAMAYRGKRVLDFNAADLLTLAIERKAGKTEFKQADGKWSFGQTASAQLDPALLTQLASSLSSMEVIEFVEENPTPADLKDKYGLADPALKATLALKENKTKLLQVGKSRGAQPGFYARLDGGGPVFLIPNEIFSSLDKDALAFLPKEFFKFNEELTSIRVEGEKHTYSLEKKEKDWKLSQPFTAAVLPEAIQPVINAATGPKADKFAAFETKNPAEYGLDKPRIKLTASTKEGKPQTLLIGKVADEKTGARFARLEGQPAVAIVGADFVSSLAADPLSFLDPVVLKIDTTKLRSADFAGSATFTLQKEGEEWKGKEAKAGKFSTDPEAMAALNALFFNLRADRIAAWGENLNLQSYGLDKPAGAITLSFEENGKTEKKTIHLGGEVKDQPGFRYARLDKDPGVFTLLPGVAAVLSRGYLDYIPKELLRLEPGTVETISRTSVAGELKLVMKDGGWNLQAPVQLKADDKTAATFVAELAILRADSIAAFPPGDLKPFGLDKPFAVIQLQGASLNKKIFLGTEPAGKPGKRFVMVEGGNAVGIAPLTLVKSMLASPLVYRDRTLAKFPDADRLQLDRGPRKAAFAKVDGTWKLVEPLNAPADQQLLDDAVDGLARLRADEFIAEKPDQATLARYGLDKPEVRWTILSSGKPVLQIHLGKMDEKTGRVYGLIPGNDLVFILDPKVTGWLMGEFRPRQVWNPPVDAVQIERLRVTAGANSFELLKKENAWLLAGKPGELLREAAVNDLMAAFAGLKLERYALDTGASLNLFGLEAPEWVVEADTPQGKRVLLIGRQEGGSKRLYARVKDAPTNDVFVISEGDAPRLTPALQSLLRK